MAGEGRRRPRRGRFGVFLSSSIGMPPNASVSMGGREGRARPRTSKHKNVTVFKLVGSVKTAVFCLEV